MSKLLVRLLCPIFLLVVATTAPPQAEATCFYPRSHTTTYFAWIDPTDSSWYSCTWVNISPDPHLYWGAIGEQTVDCDGNVYTWGDTTTCTAPANRQTTTDSCPAVCE